jgi:hypothetical protein
MVEAGEVLLVVAATRQTWPDARAPRARPGRSDGNGKGRDNARIVASKKVRRRPKRSRE